MLDRIANPILSVNYDDQERQYQKVLKLKRQMSKANRKTINEQFSSRTSLLNKKYQLGSSVDITTVSKSKIRLHKKKNDSVDDLVNIDVSQEDIHQGRVSKNGESIDKIRMMKKNESVQYIMPSEEPFIDKGSDGIQGSDGPVPIDKSQDNIIDSKTFLLSMKHDASLSKEKKSDPYKSK